MEPPFFNDNLCCLHLVGTEKREIFSVNYEKDIGLGNSCSESPCRSLAERPKALIQESEKHRRSEVSTGEIVQVTALLVVDLQQASCSQTPC